ncbi:MAG: hypothetical protein ACYS9C_00030 [Planctomycetota bacterium]|jgi:hypothetical protein
MADYDSNIIKPVDGLQNIAGLTPVKRREERKRRQQLSGENKEKDESAEDEQDESFDEQDLGNPPQGRADNENGRNPDSIGIDYCA